MTRETDRRPAWTGIDLAALVRNLGRVRERVHGRILGVVKADAYGHGAIEVARALEAAGIDWLGISFLEEGRRLRQAGIEAPILVLMPLVAEERAAVRQLRLVPVVSSLEQLELWCSDAEAGREALAIHLKVDTGMARLGLSAGELDQALERLAHSPGLRLGGLLSHLRESELPEGAATAEQEASFEEIAERVRAHLGDEARRGCLLHLANTSAALHRQSSHHHLVRVGGALYGVDLAAAVDPERAIGLEPVLSVETEIVQIREVPAGTPVGYGGRWVAERPSRLAVIPIGYADGYSSRQQGAEALVAGRRVPFAGAVSMDMTILDVTAVEATAGDPVILLGRQGNEQITVNDLATREGIGPYEILCRFGTRLEKRYRRA